jgi:arylsulfatase A-like enzyme
MWAGLFIGLSGSKLDTAVSSRSSSLEVEQPTDYTESEDTTTPFEKKYPNFVFVLADDMSWNTFGYEETDMPFATPFMNGLMKKGVQMTNYYSQEVCTPARASLLTGRYPVRLGMQFNDVSDEKTWGLPLDETTIAEAMKLAGYTTYMLGKWHLGHGSPRLLPTARGFDQFLGYMTGHSYYWSKRMPYSPLFHDFMYANTDCYSPYNGSDMTDYSTFLYRDRAVDIIGGHNYEESPMFMYLAFQAVHNPYGDYNGRYSSGVPPEYLSDGLYDLIMDNVVGRQRRQYAMSLALLDGAVESIYSALNKAGQSDNTYLIFASDNGGCYSSGGRNAPLRGTKGSLWEGGTKVDAFVFSHLLDSKVAGTQYDGLMHVSDWFPTILDLAGIDYSPAAGKALDGVSHVNAWKYGSDTSLRSYMLYNSYTNVDNSFYKFNIYVNAPMAIRNSRYKLIHSFVGSKLDGWFDMEERMDDDSVLDPGTCDQLDSIGTGNFTFLLFDLENDPYETTNLIDDTKYAEQKGLLYSALAEIQRNTTSDIYGDKAVSQRAKEAWKESGNYVVPWVLDEDLAGTRTADGESDKSFPQLCAFSGAFVSPKSD